MIPFRSAAAGLVALLLASPVAAEEFWQTTRVLMPGDTVRADDVAARPLAHPGTGALTSAETVVGQEVRHRIAAGRVVTDHDVGPPLLVRANTPVRALFRAGALTMEMTGRALEAGGAGEQVRVLNPDTSRTIRAVVVAPDTVEVRSAP